MGFGVNHVCPFVDLIRQNSQNNSEYKSPIVSLRYETPSCTHNTSRQDQGHRIARSTVGFNETVSGDVLRINVVHPERSDNSRSHDWSFESPPCVRSPVKNSRYEINEKLSDDETDESWKRSGVMFHRFSEQMEPYAEGKNEE
ncbi:unnamed protein product [Sphagnum balticum]